MPRLVAYAMLALGITAAIFAPGWWQSRDTTAMASGITVAPMLARVLPSVVGIEVKAEKKKRIPLASVASIGATADEKSSADLATETSSSTGSGVIVDAKKGIILTNQHVVTTASVVTVKLTDGREFSGKVVGADVGTDVAVVQIEPKNLVAMPMGNSDKLRVGDFTIAIGSPYGLDTSATLAMVSGLMRSDVAPEIFEDFIQIDAVINPGNSGGPLVNLRGELVGLNSASIGDRGESSIAFTIPINMVRSIADQILANGGVRRGAIGFATKDLTPDAISALDLPFAKGAVITMVVPDSPAAASGFKEGDVIVSLNNRPIRRSADYMARVASVPVGKPIHYEIYSKGRIKKTSLVVSALNIMPSPVPTPEGLTGLAGLTLGEVLPGAMEYGMLRGGRVLAVASGSPAAKLGLAVDDIITAVDGVPVKMPEDLFSMVKGKSSLFKLNVTRKGQPAYVEVER